MATKQPSTRVRDAKTGQFLPKGTEKRRPSTNCQTSQQEEINLQMYLFRLLRTYAIMFDIDFQNH